MRSIVIGALGVSTALIALPVFAQVSESVVTRTVEALRQASKPENPNTGLYSDWQVKANNIPRWSRLCLGREISPSEFQNNPSTARSIVTCVVRDVLSEEYRNSDKNDAIAVQRVAAWWMTGDPSQYNSGASQYAQKVLGFYRSSSTAMGAVAKPASGAVTQLKRQQGFYDRYMVAGYEASRRKDPKTALLYFRRALDERPNDQFALQAIRNAESALNPRRDRAPKSTSKSTSSAEITTAHHL
jgi:hypothetical protein